jgi:hypothetical protein
MAIHMPRLIGKHKKLRPVLLHGNNFCSSQFVIIMKKIMFIINYLRAGRGKARGSMLNLHIPSHNVYTYSVIF